MDYIPRKDTWELIELPHNKINISIKWAYKTNYNSGDSIERNKVHLVAKDFRQRYVI